MSKQVEIDLRNDVKDIHAMLTDGVSRYAARSADPPVSAVSLTYDCGFGAHVHLQLDSRPDFEPDGTWTHEAFGNLERPDWEKAYTTLQESDLRMTLADGSVRTIPAGTDDETYVTVFGLMLVDLLKSVRDTGELASLPKTPRCEMGVEESEGLFAWPAYEDRGQDNLV